MEFKIEIGKSVVFGNNNNKHQKYPSINQSQNESKQHKKYSYKLRFSIQNVVS